MGYHFLIDPDSQETASEVEFLCITNLEYIHHTPCRSPGSLTNTKKVRNLLCMHTADVALFINYTHNSLLDTEYYEHIKTLSGMYVRHYLFIMFFRNCCPHYVNL